MIVTCQCSLLSCNTGTTLVRTIDTREGGVPAWGGEEASGRALYFPWFFLWTLSCTKESLNFKNIKLLLLKNLEGLENIDWHYISVTLMMECSSVPSLMFNFWNHTWNEIVMIKCIQTRKYFFPPKTIMGTNIQNYFMLKLKGKIVNNLIQTTLLGCVGQRKVMLITGFKWVTSFSPLYLHILFQCFSYGNPHQNHMVGWGGRACGTQTALPHLQCSDPVSLDWTLILIF